MTGAGVGLGLVTGSVTAGIIIEGRLVSSPVTLGGILVDEDEAPTVGMAARPRLLILSSSPSSILVRMIGRYLRGSVVRASRALIC